MKNFWISTTLHWNYGDEIIWRGIKNLLSDVFGQNFRDGNHIWYNRNQDLQTPDQYRFPLNGLRGNYDNEGKLKYDVAVVAGSPEFFGPPMLNFYRHVLENDIPLLALGLGTTWDSLKLEDLAIEVLKRPNSLVVARGPKAQEIINRDIGFDKAHLMPCPAIFSSWMAGIPLRPLCQVLQAPVEGSPQAIKGKLLKGAKPSVDTLCVHLDEFVHFTQRSWNTVSFNSVDEMIFKISRYKKVVSTRLHGALSGASSGVKVVVVHDNNERIRDALLPFEGLIPSVKTVGDAYEHVGSRPESVLKFRWTKHDEYVSLIKSFMGGLR